ncbi:hypothetical protein AGMMS49546_20410 [Spirochaetia bacterium]|nr:hypothetical protein AGMMS49546_20410 [Spirochaetia bacterium]
MGLTGCQPEPGGGSPAEISFIGYTPSGQTVEIIIQKTGARALEFSPVNGDTYILKLDGVVVGQGQVTVSGSALSFKSDKSGDTFTATLSGDKLDDINNIKKDDGTPIQIAKFGVEQKPTEANPGPYEGTWEKGSKTIVIKGSNYTYTDPGYSETGSFSWTDTLFVVDRNSTSPTGYNKKKVAFIVAISNDNNSLGYAGNDAVMLEIHGGRWIRKGTSNPTSPLPIGLQVADIFGYWNGANKSLDSLISGKNWPTITNYVSLSSVVRVYTDKALTNEVTGAVLVSPYDLFYMDFDKYCQLLNFL